MRVAAWHIGVRSGLVGLSAQDSCENLRSESAHGCLCQHPVEVRQALRRGVAGTVLLECLAVHHGYHWYSAEHQSKRDEEPHLHCTRN